MNLSSKTLSFFLIIAASFIILAKPRASAATLGNGMATSGVWCERWSECAITKPHEERLTRSLRRITGLTDLQFAADGALRPGDWRLAAGGSAEARRVLMRAMSSSAAFVIEDCSGSSSVNFGQATPEQFYEPKDQASLKVWRVRLDFDDFEQMDAPSGVKAAFDEGFTFFHELLHGLGYDDPSGGRELGECEGIVNRMRSELALPLREQYFGEARRVTEKLTSVRLRFRSQSPKGSAGRRELQYLVFLHTEPAQWSADTRSLTRLDKKAPR